jgi:hypothetical protein
VFNVISPVVTWSDDLCSGCSVYEEDHLHKTAVSIEASIPWPIPSHGIVAGAKEPEPAWADRGRVQVHERRWRLSRSFPARSSNFY